MRKRKLQNSPFQKRLNEATKIISQLELPIIYLAIGQITVCIQERLNDKKRVANFQVRVLVRLIRRKRELES